MSISMGGHTDHGGAIYQHNADRADRGKRFGACRARRVQEVCEAAFTDVANGATDPAVAYHRRYWGTWADVPDWQLANPAHIPPFAGAARTIYFEAFNAAKQ